MRCWPWSSRRDPRATPESGPASTVGSSTRPRRTRSCRRSSAPSPLGRDLDPRAPTRRCCSAIRRWPGPRSRRRRRRSCAPRRRSPMSGWPRRRQTCSITSPCCCAGATCPWPTRRGCSMAVAPADAVRAVPSLQEVRALVRDYNLIPLRETFIDDCQTPVSAFLKLRENGPAFLLESADQGRVGRYSFIGFRPRNVIRWSLGDEGDPYALAATAVDRFRAAPVLDLPPFAGGAVGVFAYDLVRTVEPLGEPNPDPVGVPDLALMLTDTLVVFDHLKHTVTVLANVYADDDLEASYRRALQTIAEVRWRLAGPVPRPPVRRSSTAPPRHF